MIESVDKDAVSVTMVSKINFVKNDCLPVAYLGVTKKDAFESSVDALIQAGAGIIQPVICEKSYPLEWNDGFKKRLAKIVQGSQEQSKNYNLVTVFQPQKLANLELGSALNVYFDAQGSSVFAVQNAAQNRAINLFVGPEGGFSPNENAFFEKNNFICCALTPTIMRTEQAALLAFALFNLK